VASVSRIASTVRSSSAWIAAGSLSMVVVIAAACRGEISPAALAAAVAGKIAGSGSPVSARRGPSSAAARTRAAASVGSMRSSCRSSAPVEAQPRGAARRRCSVSAMRR